MAALILLVLLLWLSAALWTRSEPCPAVDAASRDAPRHPELVSGSIWPPARKAKDRIPNRRAARAMRGHEAGHRGRGDRKRATALLFQLSL